MVFLVLFPVTINTEAGLRTTSARLIEMLRSFGATPLQIFFKLSLPSAMPFILAGLKLGIGRGLIGDRGRRIVRLTRRPRPADQPIGRCVQHAGTVRRGGHSRRRRHRHDRGVHPARTGAGAVDAGSTPHGCEAAGPIPKLSLSGLSKRFGDLEVLRDINAAVDRGEFISLVGPSGCGKTTLLRIVAGLEPASAGEVLLDGRIVRQPGGDRGFVFQSDNLLPWRTVLANAIIGPEIAGRAGAAQRRRTIDLLRLVGLEGFEHYFPRQLSGGMRQRVNLARALAIDPEILLMDEPFSALDAQTREIMQTELMRIWEEGRKTVLFVTHQIDEAVFLSDRVLVLARRPGRIQETVAIALPRPAPARHQAHAASSSPMSIASGG